MGVWVTARRDIHVAVLFFSSRRRHTRSDRDWSSDVCSSDLDTIARLVDFVPIQFKEREPGPIARFLARLFGPLLRAAGWGLKRLPSGHSNLVDAAVAEPIETRLVAPDILGIGRVRGTKEPDIGMRVRKSGRTTGVTAGRITAIDAVVEVDYGGPTAIFREQIVSDLLSKGGDSGSPVVDENRHPGGLLFP